MTTVLSTATLPRVQNDIQASRRRVFLKSVVAASLAPMGIDQTVMANAAQATPHLNDAASLAEYWLNDENAIALVMLALPQCPVCKIVRDQQLLPLTRDLDYRDIGVFEILMTNDTIELPLTGKLNPEGPGLTPKALAKRLGIRVSPSLIFLSRRYMLAEPLIGYASPDYYWAYLSERIETARQAIKTVS